MPRLLVVSLVLSSVASAAEPPLLLVQSVPQRLQPKPALQKWLAEETRRNVEDVSAIKVGLMPELGLGVPSTPPRGWPSALKPAFQEARAACEDRLGSPSGAREGGRAMLTVTGCTDKMKQGLWTRYLQFRKATSVVEAAVVPEGDLLRVVVHHVDVGGNVRTTTQGSATPAELRRTFTSLVSDALAGRGETRPAELSPELPAADSGGKVSAIPVAKLGLDAVPIPCSSGVPSALELQAPSALGDTLIDRWKTSVAAANVDAAPAVKCTLQATEEQQNSGFGTMEVLDVLLVCGQKQHRAETALGFALRGKSAAEVISERLLKSAFKSYCAQ